MFLLDSSVFLHYLEGGDHVRQVDDLLVKINSGKFSAVIAYDAISNLKDIMLRHNLVNELSTFFEAITEFSNLHVYYLSVIEENYVVQIMFKFRINYLYALHYYIARKHNIKLISFNPVYKKIPDIKVVMP